MTELASRVTELSPEKRALLQARLKEKARGATAQPTISPRAQQELYPLSFAQEQLWVLSQLEPENPFYNIALALRMVGRLDVQALEASLNEIVQRHEVLRAYFVTERGNPVQRIIPELRLRLEVEDLRRGPDGALRDPSAIEAEARRRAAAEARQPFDLTWAPLLRVRLLRLAEDEHIALLTLHHIITDGWSTGVLVREIGLLYAAYGAGSASPLTPLPIQYADYAQWQRDFLTGPDLGHELAYWREQLRGVPPVLELPTDRPRPAVQTFNGAVASFAVPAQVAAGLAALARQEHATLFQTLLAAFEMLLYRYTHEEDFCVGTPIAGRTRPEAAPLIGFFVNTQAMRSDVAGEPSFRELLRRVRERALGAQVHQILPFDRLVEDLRPERSLSTTSIYQVMFDLEQRETTTLRLPGLTISPIETHSGTAKYDLTLFMVEGPDGLSGSFEYNTDLWTAGSLARMVGNFQTLLAGAAATPDLGIALLPILTQSEARQILDEWNDTTTDYPRGRCLHELVEEQVARTPDAIAVTYGAHSLTYAELNRQANRLAHCLQSWGVGPDVLVAVYLERSADLIVALLGIIKAGGAYLPLDIDYPAERLAFMLQDGRVPVLLTQASLADQLPAAGIKIIRMDTEREWLADFDDANLVTAVTPANLAYVIYTSGSTGIPKGVSIPQSAITRLVMNTNYIDLRPSDKIAQASNASFDAATFEIWGALLRGAQLIGVSKELALAPRAFAAFLREQEISTLFLTTALFNHIAAETPDAFRTLEHVLFGGEAVDPRWVREVMHGGPPRRLLHVYGPTESTTYASWHQVREVPANATTIPIGRPLSNTQIYVLDRHFQPVPVGVSGELCIGGDGLARGYLGRPDLTAEKFVPDPFAADAEMGRYGDAETRRGLLPLSPSPHLPITGSRLYRTGDLVRWLPDGTIEFQGRIDHQVKVRGFRIELGEIEAMLGRHPAVGQVFVMVRADTGGGDRVTSSERRVVAYLVARPGATLSAAELRTYLKEHLPEYMVPAAFVFMDAFPLNPNGKVDRQALPAPEPTTLEPDKEQVAPRTAVERFLVQKWQETLGGARVGVHDNFFEMGGNSLQAAVLVNRLADELGMTAHVRALFMAPTVAELALYLDEYYPDAVARINALAPGATAPGAAPATLPATMRASATGAVDEAYFAQFRQLIPPLPDRQADPAESAGPNPPAVFVLSPPRSGSTLLRVMLAGNPRLFSPPELDLLSFNTLAERRAAFSGKYEFWLEGPIRALMEIKQCSPAEAEAIIARCEAENWSVKRFYRQLQAWIGERILVDKTPTYPLDPAILRRAETDFRDAHYIHLLRHPVGVVQSFIEARLEELFFRHPHPFSRRELAELVYTVAHENIERFLAGVEPERQHRVWFEELLAEPSRVMEGICDFLKVPFHADMLDPYSGAKMTTGIRPDHQMVGDFKFYLRNRIDPRAADRWKRFAREDALSDRSWAIAHRLGYDKPTEAELAQGDADAASSRGPFTEIKPAPRTGPLPLSYAQQRLWFLDQFEPGSPFYNVPAAVRLTGALRIDALEQSLNEIVRRHEVLRTLFPTAAGVVAPVVLPELHIPLTVIDLCALPESEREDTAARLAAAEAQQPFDLAAGPLLRATLLRVADDAHIALINTHHIVSDGWSVGVFIRELAALYAAGVADRAADLPPLSVQYADYAAWQRRWLEGDGAGAEASPIQAQLAYWKQQLAGAPALLELPTDRPRPAVQTLRGERLTFTLDEALARKLRALGRSEGATLFMTLAAAFQLLLARVTGQDDISIGTPIAGRNRPEIEGLIGFFVNTLVLRTRFDDASGALTFRQLLKRVQNTAIEAYARQDVPFEMLVEALQPQRDMSHTPLFQAMFALQDAPLQALSLPGLTLSPLQPDTKTAKFDLTLNIVERTDVLRGALEYNTDLFDAGTATRMVGNFQALLEEIVAHPDGAVTLLSILTAAERHQILEEWNDTAADFPADTLLHTRFSAQAAATPDAIAVIAAAADGTSEGSNALTYAELDRRSNQLAHHLRGRGVGPESIVGLSTERSVETLVGIFGILKAGGAYVPLDPSYPAERIAYMIKDAGIRVVVTQARILEDGRLTIADLPPSGIVRLDTDWPEIAHHPTFDSRQPTFNNPDTLAYIIYTSGSTGRPKGVMISHRAALNLATALHRVAYAPNDGRPLRISLNAPLAFDASVQQWVMLTYGHTLVVIPQEIRGDADALLAFIRRQRIDQLDCVPSQLKLLLAAGLLDGAGWTPGLVFPGGEALDAPTWRILAAAPATEFFNMYGPTECAVDSTTTTARRAPRVPTIGRPLANVRVYVLDRQMQPVPIGVPGELYIAGAGLARGYLGRPDLTAEKFVPDPFARIEDSRLKIADSPQDSPSAILNFQSSRRLYRTGDLVRWLPDGNLEYLGRTDFQVKVRGFRIELGEIEAALRRFPAIKDAVVVAREDAPGVKRLVAYLTSHAGTPAPAAAELRSSLLETLPEYMAPATYVSLAAMPQTPNGKIDRKALPAPDAADRLEEGRAYEPPGTDTERALAEIWAQVLGQPRVGRNDNFFELGGDSILSIQVIARAAQAGLRLTPKHLFQAPTVAGLAALAALAPAAAIQAEQGLIEGSAPLTPIQRRFFELEPPRPSHWNQSLLVAVRGRLEPAALREAVAALPRQHDALRLRFERTSANWTQTHAGASDDVPFETLDLAALPEAAQRAAIETQAMAAQRSLDIVHGPLLRVIYFDLGAGSPGRLFIVIHHLVVDRVSWRTLLEDLAAAYEQRLRGQPIRLPAKTTAFRDWARRLAEYAQSSQLQTEAAFWLSQAAQGSTPLPLDYPQPDRPNTEATAHTHCVVLGAEETRSLLTQAPQAYGLDVKEMLMTALVLAWHKWADSDALWVQVEAHGRQQELFGGVDISRTVGWFTAIYPLRLSLRPGAQPGDALKTIKEQMRRVPEGGIGYGLLRYLRTDPATAAQIAGLRDAQISFNYLGQFTQAFDDLAAFAPAEEATGPDRAPETRRPFLLDVTASIMQGQLRVEWTYSETAHRTTSIESLARDFMTALQALIAHCLTSEAGGYTPSDFPDLDLDSQELAALMDELDEDA